MHELPPELLLTPFSVRDAVNLGIPRHRLRRGTLASPFHGVRLDATKADDFEQRCLAYAARMPPGHHFSHGTAARLWGMRIPRRLTEDALLDVTAVPFARASRVRGVRGHSSKTTIPWLAKGVPVSSPVDTWIALAPLLSPDELIIAGDGLLRRRSPLAALDEIRRAITEHRGCRGAARLRSALPHLRSGTDSKRETQLRLLLVRRGLPEPQVNPVISLAGAEKTRFGDLVYPEWGVVVEYDGAHHSADRATYADDLDRAEELKHLRFVHVIKEHWADPDRIAERVDAALRDGGWTRTRSRRRYLQSVREGNAQFGISSLHRAGDTSHG